ncbi:TonB-dependent receptor [Parabacteroides sp. AM08-6]|uniref:SusC/RagA family TonB-linked outer membrane protein n=1 Tax=Parabacteroides sp. AM08-6 TaxID=2292053 RepID=UPI000F00186D|nr:TonB-dependent receptor [Parabacteroides sp. AM08-6]RHJ83944.1 TonB-dependent receptor [Parabacteroides sp. AM08-6]
MDLISLKKRRKLIMILPLCVGFIGSYPLDVIASPDDTPVLEVTQAKRTVQGSVVDASTGEELIGVNIRIKGTDQGTVTDADGKFTLDVSKNAELQFTYIGYKEQTIEVGDLGVIHVKMQADNEMLDEVVVVGAGTQKKVSITGAIATVEGVTLKTPTSSLTNSLAGKLAGIISTTSSGEPGSTSSFYIRGINTFGGVATPLILLDGVEISSGDLNRIPAESIESFSLLKDASATAIYGNRGANGVMLVTTKSGAENTRTTVNVSLETSYFQPMNKIEFADGATFMRTFNEAEQARSRTPITTPRYSEEQILNTMNGVNPYVYPDVDWYDLLFKSGNMNQRANVNVQGGGSRVTYYMSLQANHDTGLLDAPKDYYYNPNINNWEYNFQNNLSYKLTSTTTIDMRMIAQIGNKKGPNYSTADLYKSVMTANPVSFPAFFPAEDDDRHIRFGNKQIKAGMFGVNPYEYMMSSFKENNYNTLNTSISINQDFGFITKGLTAKVLVNFKNWSSSEYNRTLTSYFYEVQPDSYNPETGEYALNTLRTGTDFINQSDISKAADQTFYLDARADWKRSFGPHNMTAMFMYMMREYRNGALPNRNQGYSGRLTYDYSNKYLAEFNFGYNGSERLAAEDRFEFFPAASIGWVVSSESFWEPISKYVSHFKVRGSYGLVGSDAFDSGAQHFLYQNQVGIGGGAGYTTGIPGGSSISRNGHAFNILAVQGAGWEHVKKLDIGADVSLFNQVNITFDYFRDHRDRILMRRASFPKILGYWGSTPWSNIGEVMNRGVELSVNWSKQIGKDWIVDFRGNFTYNQNEYKYVDEPDYPYVWQTNTGKPLNTLKGYIAEGLFSSQEEIDNWADQSQLGANIMPGDIKYRDVNGDGQITSEDQVMLSTYNNVPRIQYGLGLNLRYKKFDFGVFFNGSAKRKIMINSGYAPFLSSGGDGNNSETLPRNLMQWIVDEHWSVDNPNPNASYPRLGATDADISNNTQASSYWVRNGNFLRFKTLEFGYSFPHCRLYFSGDNLAVFSPFKLWDPELAWNAYPLQRTFNLGVQVTF